MESKLGKQSLNASFEETFRIDETGKYFFDFSKALKTTQASFATKQNRSESFFYWHPCKS